VVSAGTDGRILNRETGRRIFDHEAEHGWPVVYGPLGRVIGLDAYILPAGSSVEQTGTGSRSEGNRLEEKLKPPQHRYEKVTRPKCCG
jgi:hypothetical protein